MKRDPSDEEDLRKVQEFLGGDSRAFEFLFDKYRDKVYRVAYRFVHHKEDALDVTQEVFLRVHQGLSSFKTDSKFFTWLYRVTVNRAIDHARARHTRRAIDIEVVDEAGDRVSERIEHPRSQDPSEILLRKEMADRLLGAVETLSPKHRAVFVLHAFENLSYKEIADVVGCSIGTVMSRLFYARKKLREILAEYGTVAP